MRLNDRTFSLYSAQAKYMWSFTSAAPHTPWRHVPKNRNFANFIVYVFVIPLFKKGEVIPLQVRYGPEGGYSSTLP